MNTWLMQASVSILVSAAASIMPSCLLLFEAAKSMQTTLVYALLSAVHDAAGFCDMHSRGNMSPSLLYSINNVSKAGALRIHMNTACTAMTRMAIYVLNLFDRYLIQYQYQLVTE